MTKYEMTVDGMVRELPPCPRCHSIAHVRLKGKWKFDIGEGKIQVVQRFHCRECDFHYHPEPRIPKKRKDKKGVVTNDTEHMG